MASVENLKLSEEVGSPSAGGESAPGTPSSESGTQPSSPMDHETLLVAVKKQVEYYFSKENLERDAYLTSQMDASNSVSVAVVMKFSKMKNLLKGDESVLREALRDSVVCPVTADGRIKAAVKSGGRSTIILREIPADTPQEAVREIFNFDAMKTRNITSIRSDIENTWFVEMDSETDAKDTLLDLKLKRRTFNGESVKARLKTEVAVRSFYSQPPSVPVQATMGGYPGVPVSPYGSYGPNGSPVGVPGGPSVFGYPMIQQVDPSLMAVNGGPMPIPSDGSRGGGAYGMPVDGNVIHDGQKGQKNQSRGKGQDIDRNANGGRSQQQGGSGRGSNDSNNRTQQGQQGGFGQTASRPNPKGSPNSRPGASASDRQQGTRGQAKSVKGAAPKAAAGGHVPIPVDLTLQNFPPLHVDETPVPEAGYQEPYAKYSADEIISIVSRVKDAPMPLYALNGKPLNPAEHGHAMTATPNMDLLRRQRSFSIDETREQLQQGKPVHREAVAAGAVDYASMNYGDPRSGSVDETGLRDAVVSQPVTTEVISHRGSSRPSSQPGSAQRSRSNSFQQNQGNRGGRSEQPRGANAVPSASSWAALVKSSASSSTQTEPVKGAASPPRAAGGGDAKNSAKNDNKISNNTTNNKGTNAKEGDDKGNNSSGRDGKSRGNHNSSRRKDSKDESNDTPAAASWGGKSTFANILKKKGDDESATTSTGTQSEFSEISTRGARARTVSGDKGAKAGGDRRQPSTIATEADGSWARKTFS